MDVVDSKSTTENHNEKSERPAVESQSLAVRSGVRAGTLSLENLAGAQIRNRR